MIKAHKDDEKYNQLLELRSRLENELQEVDEQIISLALVLKKPVRGYTDLLSPIPPVIRHRT